MTFWIEQKFQKSGFSTDLVFSPSVGCLFDTTPETRLSPFAAGHWPPMWEGD